MKKRNINGQLIDVTIIAVALATVLLAVTIFGALLYKNEDLSGEMTAVSEPLDKKYYGSISVGDAMFDNVSKRCIGTVNTIDVEWCEKAEFRYILTLSIKSAPRGTAMRNASVWFEYTGISLCV